ncbi:pentapeptide repeat-containing protein [Leptolyngbya sp. AN02str]|uniref:pentapeptide repeat-containing protein n=1 Tax=Leptolyngbya sp. AN02str TaxID=3423363 RepID=UPI003D32426F
MSDVSRLDFSNRNLRNRSFQGKNLIGADFRGADIRGCNFGNAELIGANFEQARAGATSQQLLPLVAMALGFAGMLAYGASHLVFASLGQTPEQPAWLSVVVLHLFLGMAGAGAASRPLLRWHSPLGRWAMDISGMCSGALTGFFYVGSAANENAQAAIAGAVVGAGVMAALRVRFAKRMAVVMPAMGAVAAYGFAFLVWTVAIAWLQTERYGWSLLLGTISLIYIWCVVRALRAARDAMRRLTGTSFAGANITQARFDPTMFNQADFSGVIDGSQE